MAPFFDLVEWVRARPGMTVLDLGCGTGEITVALAERLGGATVLGIDSSEAMLAEAEKRAGSHVTFRRADIESIEDFRPYDLVFSHAALHWIADNEQLMARILGQMKPGAQIAVQVPQNGAHPSHRIAAELAAEPAFARLLGGHVQRSGALTLERYAERMHEHGFVEQQCIEKIYGHLLGSSADVVEWVRGTLLTPYLSRLDPPGQATFLAAYKERLIAALGPASPYFYPFRRLLFWGQKPA
jgi:trans-aconitate 2-methyltransferase